MTTTLLISQIVLAVFIIIAVLLQKSSSMGLGAYSGSNETMFGAKGPANFLTKLTFFIISFVSVIFILGLVMEKLINKKNRLLFCIANLLLA